jgi:hypothetical protein
MIKIDGRASQTAAVRNLIDWLNRNLDEVCYGEVGLVFTVHDGRVQYVDKVLRQKERVG